VYGTALALITKLRLTDLQRVKEALHQPDIGVRRRALQTLRRMQHSYTQHDLQKIGDLLELIGPSFPQQVERTKKKRFVGGEKDAWKCSCGHVNSLGDQRCSACKRDLHGFLQDELTPTAAQELLSAQRDALSQLLAAH
jgi:hypothetical protein